MHRILIRAVFAATVLALTGLPAGTKTKKTEDATRGPAVLWRDPGDIASRDLYYGPGGQKHAPKGPFTFESEDKNGTSPKFYVRDANGIRWTAKLGGEAQPETAASRIVWAVGYFVNEEYFLPQMQVQDLTHLNRGSNYIKSGGIVHDVRLKRHSKDEVKLGIWEWAKCPFVDTREWYGLRVMMALINNWDLKNANNAIYQIKGDHPEQRYMVADLGDSFGPNSFSPFSKGDLEAYRETKWIHSTSAEYVNFNVPSRPGGGYVLTVPIFMQQSSRIWLGRHIPRADARWIGSLLARLSSRQIRDAFRAAGYSPDEIEGYSQVLEQRIRELQQL